MVTNKDILERWTSRAPIARVGKPEEIGGAAVYLASDASSFMTGETIVIDGGVTVAAA